MHLPRLLCEATCPLQEPLVHQPLVKTSGDFNPARAEHRRGRNAKGFCSSLQVLTVVHHFFGDIEAMRKELMQASSRQCQKALGSEGSVESRRMFGRVKV